MPIHPLSPRPRSALTSTTVGSPSHPLYSLSSKRQRSRHSPPLHDLPLAPYHVRLLRPRSTPASCLPYGILGEPCVRRSVCALVSGAFRLHSRVKTCMKNLVRQVPVIRCFNLLWLLPVLAISRQSKHPFSNVEPLVQILTSSASLLFVVPHRLPWLSRAPPANSPR